MKRILTILLFVFTIQNVHAQLNVNHYINIGRAQLYAEKFPDAIESFNIIITVKPEIAEPYFLRGIAKYNLMDYIGAEQDYSKAIEYRPNHTDALRYRGYTRLNLKKYYLAINDFNEAIKLNAIDPDFYIARGFGKININQYDQAITDFNKSLDLLKKNKRAYFYRGIAKNMQEDTVGALKDYYKALEFDPDFYDVYMKIGIVYSEKKDFDIAIENFSKVIEIDPLNAGAYINRSLAHYHLKKPEISILDLDTAILIESDNSLAIFNRALIKNETGKKKEAIKDLDKVIMLNPQNILTYFNRGLIKLELNDLQGAFIDFSSAIEIYPDFAKAYSNRSIVRYKLNDARGSIADREKAEKIIQSANQNQDLYMSFTDTSENFRNLITLKSSNRFYNSPKFNERISPTNNFTFVHGTQNSIYFDRLGVLFENIDKLKAEYQKQGLIIQNDLEKAFETDFISAEIERLEKEYSHTDDKIGNLIQSSVYKSLIKNFNGGLSDINLALRSDPNNFLLYYCRANIRSDMMDYIKQLEHENEIILFNPLDNNKQNTLKTTENFTDYNLIINDYYRSLELAPEFIFSAFNLANTYLKIREYKKAIELYNKIILFEPTMAEAYFNRGLTYIYLKESENGCMDMSVSGELGLQKAYTVIGRFCEN